MIQFSYEPYEVKQFFNGVLVVYVWDKLNDNTVPKIWENVEFFDLKGKKMWTVNGMEAWQYWDKNVDCFVGTREYEGRLQLTAFSGNSFDVDMKTGFVTHFEFHK